MHAQYLKLLSDLDKILGQIRLMWIEARNPSDRENWRVRLDQLLDQRLELMRARDAAAKVEGVEGVEAAQGGKT